MTKITTNKITLNKVWEEIKYDFELLTQKPVLGVFIALLVLILLAALL